MAIFYGNKMIDDSNLKKDNRPTPPERDQTDSLMQRLLVLLLSLGIAKALFSLLLMALLLGGAAAWLYKQNETSTPEALEAEINRKTAEARHLAAEAIRLTNEPHHESDEIHKVMKRQSQEGEVGQAIQELALMMSAYQVDNQYFTDKYEDLYDYGWQKRPGFIYEDIQVFHNAEGFTDRFVLVIHHPEEGVRGSMWDSHNPGAKVME